MKIAFNIYPLESEHNLRGIGSYTRSLLDTLEGYKNVQITKFTDTKKINDVDLVHYPWFDLFFRTLPIRKKFPTVVTIHDVMPLLFPENYPTGIKGKINLKLQKLSLKSCKQIITDSNISKKDIIRFLKIDPEKIKVVPLAADKKFKILSDGAKMVVKKKYRLPNKFLLYVGDANYVKNLPFLIKGFNNLINNTDFKDYKLVLAGSVFLKKVTESEHPELKSLVMTNNLIKELKLEGAILRPGFIPIDDLVGFYNLATIYVQPSLYEGFGLPVLEAFSCGCPVASSSCDSLKEVGEGAALYFSPTNLDEFDKLLTKMLSDIVLRNKLSEISVKQALKFSWKKTTDETIKIYEQTIK